MTAPRPPDLFPSLSPAGAELIQRRLVSRTFAKGEKVIGKGDPVSGAYFVLSGRLRVYTQGPTGKEATIYLIEPGETCVLALNSLFNAMDYPAWVEAEAETTLGILPGPAYRTLFSTEKNVQDVTVSALSGAVFRLMAALEQRHDKKLDQRLAEYLLATASKDGLVAKTQQEIAGHIGTTREVIARLLGVMSGRGLIETARGRIKILDANALDDLRA